MVRTISTSMWINFRNLRFFLLQYLMLVIIFPVSYLLISLTSAGSVMDGHIRQGSLARCLSPSSSTWRLP